MEAPEGERRYWAFISYSHVDASWGRWLHTALETFRVPTELIGRRTLRDHPVPESLRPVFLDREELPTAADLAATIRDALARSRYLIVVCSPSAARSRWVSEEIRAFKALGRSDRILALIVSGEPNADGKAATGEECFPEALRHAVAADGSILAERVEPIAADIRPGGDGKEEAKLRIAAGLLGVGFDELRRREQMRAASRARRFIAAAASALLILASLAIALFVQREAAREATRRVTQRERELRLALARSDDLAGARLWREGRREEALAFLARALRLDPGLAPAQLRLLHLLTYSSFPLPACPEIPTVAPVRAITAASSGRRVAAFTSLGVHVFDAATSISPVAFLPFPAPRSGHGDHDDPQSGATERRAVFDGRLASAVLWTDDRDETTWQLRDVLGGRLIVEDRCPGSSRVQAAFAPDGGTLALALGDQLLLIDPSNGGVRWSRSRPEGDLLGISAVGTPLFAVSEHHDPVLREVDGVQTVYMGDAPTLSPDGTRVVSSLTDRSRIALLDLLSRRVVSVTITSDREVTDTCCFDPTSTRAVLDGRGAGPECDLIDAASGAVKGVWRDRFTPEAWTSTVVGFPAHDRLLLECVSPFAHARHVLVVDLWSERPLSEPLRDEGPFVWIAGDRVVTAAGAALRIFDVANHAATPGEQPEPSMTGRESRIVWSPRGDRRATLTDRDEIDVYDTLSGRCTAQIVPSISNAEDGRVTVADLRFDPTGDFLVAQIYHGGGGGGPFEVWDATDGRLVLETSHEYVDVRPSLGPVPAWLPDLAEAIGGLRLDALGVIDPVEEDPWTLIERVRASIAADTEWGYSAWGRWFLAPAADRSDSPPERSK